MFNTKRIQRFINLINTASTTEEALNIFKSLLSNMDELEKGLLAFWLASENLHK